MFINRFLKRFVSPEKYARLIGVNMGKITSSQIKIYGQQRNHT